MNSDFEFIFKDVGQGDSILFKWKNENQLKIGIIDSNRYENQNPILQELQKIDEPFEISFILISHGHTDHYSGIVDILEYASTNNIKIVNVSSTIQPVIFPYLQITLARSEKSQIVKLVDTINKFNKSGHIQNIYPIYDSISSFIISDSIKLECMFPKNLDYDKLGKRVLEYANGTKSTKPDLNNISAIFKLSFPSGNILFTSDSPKHALNSILKEFKDQICHLIQVPHHGSIKNHSNAFWGGINKIENCPAVVSCGDTTHLLPDHYVVKEISDRGFKIYSTNYVNGIKEFVEGKTINNTSSHLGILNTISICTSSKRSKINDRLNGDQHFKLLESGKLEYIKI